MNLLLLLFSWLQAESSLISKLDSRSSVRAS